MDLPRGFERTSGLRRSFRQPSHRLPNAGSWEDLWGIKLQNDFILLIIRRGDELKHIGLRDSWAKDQAKEKAAG
jgi:hypothetical protein